MAESGSPLSEMLSGIRALEPLALPLLDSLGCVLAETVISLSDVPAFATAAFTGYAVRSTDQFPGEPQTIVDDVPAGFRASEQLTARSCIRVARGAPIPDDADAIVDISRARRVDGGVILEAATPGQGVIAVGDLIRSGESLAHAGQTLDADLLGILARAGIRAVMVHPRPRVLVVTIGTEYVEPGVPTPIGLVADHLSYLAAALVTECGGTAFRIPPVLDDLDEVEQVVEDNSHRSDLIVLCGLETETAPAISGALGLNFLAHSTGGPVVHGMAGGAVIVGLPDDLTQLRVSAREVLPGILDRLMGRAGQ